MATDRIVIIEYLWYNSGMNQKSKLFESATQNLLQEINSVGLTQTDRMRAKNFALLFRDSFKQDAVKRATFSQTIGDDYKLFPYDSYGFCKAASCSFVALMPAGQWQVMYIDDLWTYGPHYYVQHIPTKKIIDFTYDQYVYDGVQIPYYMGRPVKIDNEARNTAVRFLHAVGLDFSALIRNNGKE